MPPETYVTTHIHTEGPIPGPHSLLTVTAAAHTAAGDLIGSTTVNVRELPGATLHPVALQQWRRRAEDWLSSRRASRPPAPAMTALTRWIDDLPGRKVFVADTAEPDYLFLYWYLQRFTGRWPFTRTTTEAGLHARLTPTELCPLTGCRSLARTG
ncbi:hypothetical protein [Pseudonocardia sp.]|jgi:hypothetical protein|uniref:hypothetical protein n=1 Tax=Pseudonocardia sp. TaxID=60912 RepID=UPI002622664C|nr:hypothetical protein [Pseudonocardia sp.]MCW2722034.1 hypothetical protein [Pseudonocardia sp.]MDT7618683.1 hypothetical protein [Pseudonocardiales bacterium]